MEREENPIQPENLKEDNYLEERVTGYNNSKSSNGVTSASNDANYLNHVNANINKEVDQNHDETNNGESSNVSSVSSSLNSSLSSSLSSFSEPKKANGYQNMTDSADFITHPMEMTHSLTERMSIIDSIKWLGNHLPESVVAFLIDEIEVEEAHRFPIISYDDNTKYSEITDHVNYNPSMDDINGPNSEQYQYDKTYPTHKEQAIQYENQDPQNYHEYDENNHNTQGSSMYKEYYQGDCHHEYKQSIGEDDRDHIGSDVDKYSSIIGESESEGRNNIDRQSDDSTRMNLDRNPQEVLNNDEAVGEYSCQHFDSIEIARDNGGKKHLDENDSLCLSGQAPLHLEANQSRRGSLHESMPNFYPNSTPNESEPKRRVSRRSSLPLVVRSMEGRHETVNQYNDPYFRKMDVDENDSLSLSGRGPLHLKENQTRRHSLHESMPDLSSHRTSHESTPKRRVFRRSSMPLVVRSMEGRRMASDNRDDTVSHYQNASWYDDFKDDNQVIAKDNGKRHADGDSLSLSPQDLINTMENHSRHSRHSRGESLHDSMPDLHSSRRMSNESGPKRRAFRRSSMPLVVRSMEGRRNHYDESFGSDSSLRSGSSFPIRNVKQNSGFFNQTPRPKRSTKVIDLFGTDGTGSAGHFAAERNFSDRSLPLDGEDNSQRKERLRKRRFAKTRDSINKLCGDLEMLDVSTELDVMNDDSEWDHNNMYFTDTIPPATRHDCALLFVDISGFTKVSMTLEVEALSKVRRNRSNR